jgi:hypothetical protein
MSAAALLTGCGGSPAAKQEADKPAVAARPRVQPSPQDRSFPPEGRIEVVQSADPLYGKPFLTGGNIARYKRGGKQFELFLIKSANESVPASMMFAYKKTLTEPKFVAHFGGYSGQDSGVEVFLFSKGVWLAGIRGLPLAEADVLARDFAARLN